MTDDEQYNNALRFVALLGAGEYTRLDCSVSTVPVGCIAALLRNYCIINKKLTFYG